MTWRSKRRALTVPRVSERQRPAASHKRGLVARSRGCTQGVRPRPAGRASLAEGARRGLGRAARTGADPSQAWAASSGRGGTRTVSAAAERAGSAPGKRVLVPTWVRGSPHPVECVRSWGAFGRQPAVPRRPGDLANTKEGPRPGSALPGCPRSCPRGMPTALKRSRPAAGPFVLAGPRAASRDTRVCSGETHRLVSFFPARSCFAGVNTGTLEVSSSPAGRSPAGQADGH